MHLWVTQWLITDSNTHRLLFQDIFVGEVVYFSYFRTYWKLPSHTSALTLQIDFSLLPVKSCQRFEGGFLLQFWVIPRTNTRWRFELALGAANERPPILPVDQSEARTGCILLEGCGRQGMWGWHSGLEPAISTVLWSNLGSKTSLYQIWEHVFVIILAGQKVWSVPILIMAIICHPVTRRNNNL